MKYLAIFILLFLFDFIQAQSFPSYEDQPIWNLDYYGEEGVGIAEVRLRPPVTICGQSWTPIEEEFSDTDWEGGTVIGYYRQENTKVYYRRGINCDERSYLMYDFSLEEGDSVFLGIPGSFYFDLPDLDSMIYHIDSVDTLSYGGLPRKVLYVSFRYRLPESGYAFYHSIWLEGIGDLYHPFPSAICFPSSHSCEVFYNGLNCLNTIDGTLYANNENQCNYDWPDLTKIYVDQNVSKTAIQDGRSWSQAFAELQDAIALADPGDTIWVAKGIYYPTFTSDRTVSFELKKGVKLYGGFVGNELNLSDRNWEAYSTKLSGNIGDTLSKEDNSYHVLYALGVDSTTVLDGFVIQNGYAIHTSPTYAGLLVNGGGLLVDTNEENPISTPVITNCQFINNIAKNGGAVYCNGNLNRFASPFISNCRFYQNVGEGQGGAILKTGKNPSNEPQFFLNCVFEQNWARQNGAGVGLVDAGGDYFFINCIFRQDTAFSGSGGIHFMTFLTGNNLELIDCQFDENEGGTGGALSFIYTGNAIDGAKNAIKIDNSLFVRNSARTDIGGAILIYNSGIIGELTIQDSYFEGNSSLGKGGAIQYESNFFAASNIKVTSSIFRNNRVRDFPGGGAISIRGDVTNASIKRSKTLISNSLFDNNSGAFTLESGFYGVATAEIVNCTFYENGSFPFVKNWSNDFEMDTFYSSISFKNSIIWEPSIEFAQLFINGNPLNQHLYGYTFDHCLISDKNCDLEGGDTACGLNNIFYLDPKFINPDNKDFRLKGCSPIINKGINTAIVDLSQVTDLAGEERIQEDNVDIGAYEQLSSSILADYEIIHPDNVSNGAIELAHISGGIAPYSFIWNTGDTTSSITEISIGNYILTITDAEDCMLALTFKVEQVNSIAEEHNFIQMKVAPNPTRLGELLQLLYQISIPGIYQIMMTDISGKVLKKQSFNFTSKGLIDLSKWPKAQGVYFFTITKGTLPITTAKIVVN